MPRYPRSLREGLFHNPGQTWPAVDVREITPNATEDIPHGSTRAVLVGGNATLSFVPAIEDHSYTRASVTIGTGNARFDATATRAQQGTAGNNLRVVVASSSTATPGVTVSFATASGVSTITFTFRPGAPVTAEYLVLSFTSGENLLGEADEITAAREAIGLSLTSGSDGSSDIAVVASTALTGGAITIGRRVSVPLAGGIFHPIAARLIHSVTGGVDVFGVFDAPDTYGNP